jgi:hypothetical protein
MLVHLEVLVVVGLLLMDQVLQVLVLQVKEMLVAQQAVLIHKAQVEEVQVPSVVYQLAVLVRLHL